MPLARTVYWRRLAASQMTVLVCTRVMTKPCSWRSRWWWRHRLHRLAGMVGPPLACSRVVVLVAPGGAAAAAGGLAGAVAGGDVGLVGGGGAAAEGAVVQQSAVLVGDAVAPGRPVFLVEGDLAGDVGDDRSPAGDEGRVVVEAHQGGQVDAEVDHAAARGGLDAPAGAALPPVPRRVGVPVSNRDPVSTAVPIGSWSGSVAVWGGG